MGSAIVHIARSPSSGGAIEPSPNANESVNPTSTPESPLQELSADTQQDLDVPGWDVQLELEISKKIDDELAALPAGHATDETFLDAALDAAMEKEPLGAHDCFYQKPVGGETYKKKPTSRTRLHY